MKQKANKSCKVLLNPMDCAGQCEEEDGNQESEDEDLDNTACILCGTLWRIYIPKGTWLICDICDDYMCPKCVQKNTDLKAEFHCSKCSA